jgi:hypothetical protein
VELWGGKDKNSLKLLKTIKTAPVAKEEKNVVKSEGLKIEIQPAEFRCLKIIAKNVLVLPPWHPGKGEKGWVFIDEIFIN